MAIKMVYEPLHKQGQPDITRPAVICDWCNEEIRQAWDGLYVYDGGLENEAYWRSEPIDFYTVHKDYALEPYRGCWRRFVASKGWGGDEAVTDGELSWLPIFMTNVLGVDTATGDGGVAGEATPTAVEVPSFKKWLVKQRHRRDKVGDLARDAHEDREWPKGRPTLARLESYLTECGACAGAFEALGQAWREHQRLRSS